MAQGFSKSFDRVESQGRTWASITPSDSATLSPIPKALWANVAGDIAITGEDGTSVTFTVAASTPIPLCPTKVLSTGTTATGIKAIYG